MVEVRGKKKYFCMQCRSEQSGMGGGVSLKNIVDKKYFEI